MILSFRLVWCSLSAIERAFRWISSIAPTVCCFACTRASSAATLSTGSIVIEKYFRGLAQICVCVCLCISNGCTPICLKVSFQFCWSGCGGGCGRRKHFTSLFGIWSKTRMCQSSQIEILNWQWSNQFFALKSYPKCSLSISNEILRTVRMPIVETSRPTRCHINGMASSRPPCCDYKQFQCISHTSMHDKR